MAQPWCTGAAHIFVGTGASQTPVYLGTCADRPKIDGRPKFEAIMNDLYGGNAGAPFDFSFLGQIDVVTAVFSRFNWATFRSLTTFPNNAGTQGLFLPGDVGTIMGLEGFAFPLWVQFPYSTKTAMATMDAGRHYHQTILFDPHGITPGTRSTELSLIWLCYMKFTASTQRATLFDVSMTGLPTVD